MWTILFIIRWQCMSLLIFLPMILVRWYLIDTDNIVHRVHLAQVDVLILGPFASAKKSLAQATRSSSRAACSIAWPLSPSQPSCSRSSSWPSCWSQLTVSIICQINWFIGSSSRSSSRAASNSGRCCRPLRKWRTTLLLIGSQPLAVCLQWFSIFFSSSFCWLRRDFY